MTMREKIAKIVFGKLGATFHENTGNLLALELADAIIKALPDYDAQQARIKELEAYLKLNKQKGDAQDRKLEAQKQLALKGEDT
tara:strand:- start:288 stop:539 length:252 start_codon:yes stop_codon:yes gene_type:complete